MSTGWEPQQPSGDPAPEQPPRDEPGSASSWPPSTSSTRRRGTDGLDWQSRPSEPRPAATPPGNPPPARAPAGAGRFAALGLAAGLVGGLLAGGGVAYIMDGDGDDGGQPAAAAPGNGASLTVQQTSAIAEVAAKARPGVVKIESVKRTAAGGSEQDVGSGVTIDNQGHIVTNAHVVLETDSLKVILADGTERPAILVGHDFPFSDVAVLQIGPGGLTPLPVGDSTALRLGETVVAIGNPLAEFDGTVSVGVVSGLNRKRTFDSVRQDDLVQTDAAVNSGNSGGALLNLQGQFIGMPTAVLRQSRGGQPVEGIAFALPSNRVMEVANRIIAEGSYPRPSLNVDHLDLTAELLSRITRQPVNEGALISEVASGGAADMAGIREGDIITKLGDQDVNRANPLYNALMAFEPGETAKVVLNRNGRIIEAEVRFAKRS